MNCLTTNEWITIILALAALISSIVLTISQIFLARTANRLPVGIDLLREFRSEQFKKDKKEASDIVSRSSDYSRLTDDEKRKINSVTHFYDNLGLLVYNKTIKKSFVLPFLGHDAVSSWNTFRGYINAERQGTSTPIYQSYFEYLANISSKYSINDIRKKLKLT